MRKGSRRFCPGSTGISPSAAPKASTSKRSSRSDHRGQPPKPRCVRHNWWEQAAVFQLERLAKAGIVTCYARNDRLEFNIPYELYGNPRISTRFPGQTGKRRHPHSGNQRPAPRGYTQTPGSTPLDFRREPLRPSRKMGFPRLPRPPKTLRRAYHNPQQNQSIAISVNTNIPIKLANAMLMTLSGPSGAGKSTLSRFLKDSHSALELPSYTTRHEERKILPLPITTLLPKQNTQI